MTRMLQVGLITLGDPGRLTGGYLYHRRMAEAAPRHGAHLRFVSFPERPFPLAMIDAPAVLRRAWTLGARVLVIDSIAAGFLGPWLALRRPAVPLIGMLHQPPGGIDHGPLRTAVQARLDRLAYRRMHCWFVASASLAEQLRAERFPPTRIEVIVPGRDVAAIPGPPPGDLRRGRRAAFLCVSNWLERKGIHDLLDAFAALPADTATLHLAGDNRADPRYAARIGRRLTRPDLAGRVVVHGPLSAAQVAALYTAADAFVLPSWREPYGTVYGEAMAAGLPVVGWHAGNLPYLAEHEREGLLVPRGDLATLTDALLRLATDARLRQRLGAAAQRRALTWSTWEESANQFFGAIRSVAEQRSVTA